MRLFPCASCARHVRGDETECPFCRHTVAFCALLFAGATALAGCERKNPERTSGEIYGAPPMTADAEPMPMIEPPNVMDAGAKDGKAK